MRFFPFSHLHRTCGSAALCALLLSGCSVSNESVADKNAGATKKAGGELKVPGFGDWFSQAWKRYNTKAAPVARVVPSPRVFDNRNATRPASHPAWQLASELSNDAPLQFNIAAANVFRLAALQNRPFNVGPLGIGDVSALRPLRGGANSNRDNFSVTQTGNADVARALQRWQLSALGSRTAFAQELPALQNQIEARQRNAVDALLAQSLNAQDKARTNIARSLEATLQDDIALARRLDPGALEPYLPSELQALALSNLRLDLLPAIDKSPAQERASNEERVRRDISIRAALREQELARRSALKRLREDLPIQLEAAKRKELEQTLAAQNQRDGQLRAQSQDETHALIAQDFTAAEARLGIVLPAQSPANLVAALPDVERPISNLNRTGNARGASFGAGEIKISSIRANAVKANAVRPALKTNPNFAIQTNGQAKSNAQNTILKTLARHDAHQWARISARRDQAWQPKPTATPAKTGAVAKSKP